MGKFSVEVNIVCFLQHRSLNRTAEDFHPDTRFLEPRGGKLVVVFLLGSPRLRAWGNAGLEIQRGSGTAHEARFPGMAWLV